MRRGEMDYVGDPPHEPQGWYSVFDNDASTLDIIRQNAAALKV
jgi:mannan endo-1,4-beta-mannosidase